MTKPLIIAILVYLGGFGVAQADPVNTLKDVSYGSHPRQIYDVYIPHKHSGRTYLVVHGGGWTKGDKAGLDIWQDKVAHWAPKGIAVVAMNYRFVPDVTPRDQAQDIGQAMAHLRDTLPTTKELVLIGHSAGAHLALLIHFDLALQQRAGGPLWDASIILDTSAIDVTGVMERGPWHLWYDVFGRDPGVWPSYSPLDQMTKAGPPILAICSTLRPAPCPQNDLLKTRAASVDQSVDVFATDMDHLPINEQIGIDPKYTAKIDSWIDAQLSN